MSVDSKINEILTLTPSEIYASYPGQLVCDVASKHYGLSGLVEGEDHVIFYLKEKSTLVFLIQGCDGAYVISPKT